MPLDAANPDTARLALQTDLWDTLIRSATANPTLTVEEELAALAAVTQGLADTLRRSQQTPAQAAAYANQVTADAAAMPLPHPHVVASLTAAFKQVLAHASRCPSCGRLPDDRCRCLVRDRPDPYPVAITAIFPLIAALTAGPQPAGAAR